MWQKMHIIRMYSENFIRCGSFTVMGRSDEYVYGNLDAFAFERTQTLATGGEKCDFCLRKR